MQQQQQQQQQQRQHRAAATAATSPAAFSGMLWPTLRLVGYAVTAAFMFREFKPTWGRECDSHQKEWCVVMLSLMGACALLRLVERRLRGLFVVSMVALSVGSLVWSLYGIHVVFQLSCCDRSTYKWSLGIWLFEFIISTGPKLLLMVLFVLALVGVLFAGRNGANPWISDETMGSGGDQRRAPTPAPVYLRKKLNSVLWKDISRQLGETHSTVVDEESVASPDFCYSQPPTAVQSGASLPPTRLTSSQPPPTTAAAISEALRQPIASLNALLLREDAAEDSVVSQVLRPTQQQQQPDVPSCPICFSSFEGKDRVVPMPCDPRHIFHHSCLFTWFDTSGTCPVCRRDLVDLLRTESGEAAAVTAASEPTPAAPRWWFRRRRP